MTHALTCTDFPISFVCATSKETGDTVCLASYRSPRSDNSDLLNATTIWQACRTTSAATTFFGPIAIGPFDEEFVDGALGANNPVYALWNQAQDVWGVQLGGSLRCFVSVARSFSVAQIPRTSSRTGRRAGTPMPIDTRHLRLPRS